jgi:hypothetical protein
MMLRSQKLHTMPTPESGLSAWCVFGGSSFAYPASTTSSIRQTVKLANLEVDT